MVPTGAINASQEYKNLLQPILDQALDLGFQKSTFRCSEPVQQSTVLNFHLKFPKIIPAIFNWVWRGGQQTPILPQVHPATTLIKDQILKLPPFKDLSPKKLFELAVGIQIPSWLMDTEEVCHIIDAVESTFGRVLNIETSPSSAYTAAGYELCRISRDAFECEGRGNIMTIEYDGSVVVASVMQTLLFSWATNPVAFSARAGLTSKSMTEWINQLIDSQRPDKLILVGTHAREKLFIDTVANSRATVDSNGLAPDHILAFWSCASCERKDGKPYR